MDDEANECAALTQRGGSVSAVRQCLSDSIQFDSTVAIKLLFVNLTRSLLKMMDFLLSLSSSIHKRSLFKKTLNNVRKRTRMTGKRTRMTDDIDRATRSGIIVSLVVIIQRTLPFKVATLRTLQHF